MGHVVILQTQRVYTIELTKNNKTKCYLILLMLWYPGLELNQRP